MRKKWEPWEDDFLREKYFLNGVVYCTKHLGRSPGSVAHRVSRLGLHRRGENIVRMEINSMGYLEVRGSFYRKMVHVMIGEMKIGRELKKGEVVHHIDGDLLNNHPDNLQVMTISEHQKVHWGENCDGRRNPVDGRFV